MTTTTNHGDPNRRTLSDSELDAVLSAAGNELLDYIRAAAHPDAGLLAIMGADNRETEPGHAARSPLAPAPSVCAQHAVAVIEVRTIARLIVEVLDVNRIKMSDVTDSLDRASAASHMLISAFHAATSRDLERTGHHARTLTQALTAESSSILAIADYLTFASTLISNSANALKMLHDARDLIEVLDRARDLIRDLIEVLDRARDLVREIDLNYAGELLKRKSDRGRADALDRARALTATLAHAVADAIGGSQIVERTIKAAATTFNPIHQLASIRVDASGADLSGLEIPYPDVLEGVIWTAETIWPSDVAGQVLARSDEIRPGIFQVRGGSERDRCEMVTL